MTPSVKIEHAGRREAVRPVVLHERVDAVVVGAAAFGAVVLYAATTWLWLVVHEGLR